MINAGVTEWGSTEGAKNSVAASLDLIGMTCASCANRIEKKLNKVDGMQAIIDYVTERARVQVPKGTIVQDPIAVVEVTSYEAREIIVEPREECASVFLPWARLAFTLTVSATAVSMVPVLQFSDWQWLALLLTTTVMLWCGHGFHRATLANVRHGTTTADILVDLGILVARPWSVVVMFFDHAGTTGMTHEFTPIPGHIDPTGSVYFETAAGVVAFLLPGRWIGVRSRWEAGSVVWVLLEVGIKGVTILCGGAEIVIPVGKLSLSGLIVARSDEKVAADGVVVEGNSVVDAAVITGKPLPVEVGPGSAVVGGSIDTTGRPVVKAVTVESATQVVQIVRSVEEVQADKVWVQHLVDRVMEFPVSAMLVLSTLTSMIQLFVGAGLTLALTAGMTVLIAAYLCALGLATSLTLLVGTSRGVELGATIRDIQALEEARPVQAVMLNKTGTLTTGRMSVLEVTPVEDVGEVELLAAAAVVEAGSEHPIARAVVERVGDAPAVGWLEALPGIGVRALPGEVPVAVGSRHLLTEQGIEVPGEVSRGGNEVFVVRDGALLGRIVVGDQLEPGAAEAAAGLRDLGLRPMLLTGDSWVAVWGVASQVSIKNVHAEVLPQGKVEVITGLQVDGVRMAMVGDGVNDVMVFTTFDPGIAMDAGIDVAMAASDFILMHGDLMDVVGVIRFSRATERIIRDNLSRAFFYNVMVIPVVVLGSLTLMITSMAMVCSSAFMVPNSLRSRNFRQDRFSGFPRISPTSLGSWGIVAEPAVAPGFDPWGAGVNEGLFPVGRAKGHNWVAWPWEIPRIRLELNRCSARLAQPVRSGKF